MIEKVKVYKNKDTFQQLCNCCPVTSTSIKSFKLDVTLSNGQKQILRLCREHLNELERSISILNMNEYTDEEFFEKIKISQELANEIEAYRTIIDIINAYNVDKYEWKEALIEDKRNDELSSKFPNLQKLRIHEIRDVLENGYEIEIEKTPEEIIKERFEMFDNYTQEEREHKFTICFVLDTLGIEIKGVNK